MKNLKKILGIFDNWKHISLKMTVIFLCMWLQFIVDYVEVTVV